MTLLNNNQSTRLSSSGYLTLIIICIMTVLIFATGFIVPLEYNTGLLFLLPVYYTSVICKELYKTGLIIIIVVLLLAFGIIYNISTDFYQINIFNRSFEILVVLISGYIIYNKKQSENRMAESEEQFYSAVSNSPVPKMIYSEDGEIIHINEAWRKITGYYYEEFSGISGLSQRLLDKPSIFDIQDIEDFFLRKKKLRRGVSRIKTRRGDYRYWEFHISALRGKRGGRRLLLCTALDITRSRLAEEKLRKLVKAKLEEVKERQKAEQKLIENQALLQQMLDILPVGIWFSDENGIVNRGNKKAVEIWEAGEMDMQGRLKFDAWWAESGEKIDLQNWASFRAVFYGQSSFDEILNIRSFRGNYKTILNSAVPVIDSSNRTVGALIVNQDITELKKVENELRLSEERFRIMTDSLPQIVWTAKPDGMIDYTNTKRQEFSGQTMEDGNGTGWHRIIHPEDIKSVLKAWQHSVKTGEIYETSFRIRASNGTYRWFLSRAVPMQDSKGKIIKWFGTSTDIHSQKEIEEKLKNISEKLERSNHELENFAYVASHDLQEPIRMVSSYMKLFLQKYSDLVDDKGKEYICFAVEGAKRMHMLIKDLLKYSRVTTEAKEFVLTDLSAVLEDVLQDLQMTICESNATIEHPAKLPVVNADPVQMRQLLQNLIGNAIKFKKGKNPEIKIDFKKNKDKYLFSIQDNGIGINSKFYERIFIIFQRLHEREKYPGTGIGLSICKKIVERHGGKMWVESEEGKGSTFFFTLQCPDNVHDSC